MDKIVKMCIKEHKLNFSPFKVCTRMFVYLEYTTYLGASTISLWLKRIGAELFHFK